MSTFLRRGRFCGFTLVEMMVAIAVLGTLLAIGIPQFQYLIRNNRRTVTVNELIISLMQARSETSKLGRMVTACALTASGGTACTGGTNWSYGWMVFADTNSNGAYDAGETLLRRYVNPYSLTITAAIASNPTAAPAGEVELMPFNQPGTAATITVCDPRGATEARSANLVSTGRVTASVLNSSGAPLDVNGNTLTCP